MYKIKNIKLNNFKFFFGEQNLKLDKKHTLIYGENGSGKSSIYWALHCFLHSTLKPNVASVQKYFLPISQSEESIKNRYAQDGDKSGVSITLEHLEYERYANINAEISNNVVNTQTNHDIKLMALSSELINYKVVYNMYLATNKSTLFNHKERSEFILDLAYRGFNSPFIRYPEPFFNECAIRNDMAIAFDPEGYAYKCWEVIGNKEYAIGKLNDDGILTDINQTVLNRQLYGADTFDDPACSKCKYLPICNGGCPIQRIENKFEGGHNDCCTYYKGFTSDFLKIHIARKKAQEAATEK